MTRAARHIARGMIIATLSVGLGMAWAALSEAKNCTGADCQCGDTLVSNAVIGSSQTFQCPNVDQALKIADNARRLNRREALTDKIVKS